MRTKRRTIRSMISLLALTTVFTVGGVAGAGASCVAVWANATVEGFGPVGPDGCVHDPGWSGEFGHGPQTISNSGTVDYEVEYGFQIPTP